MTVAPQPRMAWLQPRWSAVGAGRRTLGSVHTSTKGMQRRRRKMETNMKSSRFTWLALASFCVAAVVAPLLAIPASQAGATSSSATMAETMGVAGVLSVTLQNASLNYGSALGVGTPTGDEPIGSVTYSNTLGDGSSWSVTVAATDLVISPAPSSCTVRS